MILIALGAMKNPLGLPVYIRIMALFGAILFFFTRIKLSKTFLLPLLLVLFGFVGSIYHGLYGETQIRLLQIFFYICLAHFISRQPLDKLPDYLSFFLLPIAAFLMIYEFVFIDPHLRNLFGILLPRFSGIQGHHNYNAMLCGAIGMMLVMGRRYFPAAIFFFSALGAASRGFFLASIISFPFFFLKKNKFTSLLFWTVLAGTVGMPLFILWFDTMISDDFKKALTLASSMRYVHWMTYINMGIMNPIFGVGYFNGKVVYADYLIKILPTFEKYQQAHNLFIHIFGEFGVVGYLLMSTFIFSTAYKIIKLGNFRIIPLFTFLLVGYTFYDAITEWALWVGIGYIYAYLNSKRYRCNSGDPKIDPGINVVKGKPVEGFF
jgi:hypothetical protein